MDSHKNKTDRELPSPFGYSLSVSFYLILIWMLGGQKPHNPTRYSHIMVLTPHFYAHIREGLKVILPPVCKHTWFQIF